MIGHGEIPRLGMAPGSRASMTCPIVRATVFVMSSRSNKSASRERKRRQKADRRAERSAYVQRSARTYWHGGVPGLRLGTILLPAGGGMLASQSARGASNGGHLQSGKVYFTTDELLARAYAQTLRAAGRGTGTLYKVEPLGEVERDPDYGEPSPAISFMADRARIVAVVEENVTSLTSEQVGEAFGRFQFWPGPEPYCAPDGTVRPGPGLRDEGWTYGAFALLPRWTLFEELWRRLAELVLHSPETVVALAPAIAERENLALLGRYLPSAAISAIKNVTRLEVKPPPPEQGLSRVRRLFQPRRGKS